MERRLAAILQPMCKDTATSRSFTKKAPQRLCAPAGDGVVAEFPSIVEAIRCTAEIQNEIAERNVAVPEALRMQFRIGVNLGVVIAEENRLYGTGVNVAVRLQQLAEPGGIFVSQPVYDQARSDPDEDYVRQAQLVSIPWQGN